MLDYLQHALHWPQGELDILSYVIGFMALFFMYLMWRAHKVLKLDWTDMITYKGTSKVSLTKLLQLVGGITSTWVMIYLTQKSKLEVEYFMIYLTYVGAIEGWSKFVAAKYNFSPAPAAPDVPDSAPRSKAMSKTAKTETKE